METEALAQTAAEKTLASVAKSAAGRKAIECEANGPYRVCQNSERRNIEKTAAQEPGKLVDQETAKS